MQRRTSGRVRGRSMWSVPRCATLTSHCSRFLCSRTKAALLRRSERRVCWFVFHRLVLRDEENGLWGRFSFADPLPPSACSTNAILWTASWCCSTPGGSQNFTALGALKLMSKIILGSGWPIHLPPSNQGRGVQGHVVSVPRHFLLSQRAKSQNLTHSFWWHAKFRHTEVPIILQIQGGLQGAADDDSYHPADDDHRVQPGPAVRDGPPDQGAAHT